jgi:antibiotic biosynthesis monooxygenase (ABM) superfamily enzyme
LLPRTTGYFHLGTTETLIPSKASPPPTKRIWNRCGCYWRITLIMLVVILILILLVSVRVAFNRGEIFFAARILFIPVVVLCCLIAYLAIPPFLR